MRHALALVISIHGVGFTQKKNHGAGLVVKLRGEERQYFLKLGIYGFDSDERGEGESQMPR